MSPITQFERETHEQPSVLERLVHDGRSDAEEIARAISAFNPQSMMIAARGSSDNAARYAQYVFGAHNKLAAGLALPSLYTIYDSPPTVKSTLVMGISQSGESPDIAAVIEDARRQGALTLALTNEMDSPLARAAELCLPLHAGKEKAVAATKTYTTQLFAIAMLSAALDGSTARWDELTRLPDQLEEAIRLTTGSIDDAAAIFQNAQHFVVIGRGYNYATAFEIALKIKETSYIIAEPYSSADFRHGPIAMVDPGFPIVLIAPSGRALADVAELVDVLTELKARIVAITDQPGILAHSHAPLPLPSGIPEWLSPIVSVVPGQLWALALATSRGFDPDRPRGLSKVTHTF